MTKPNTNKEKEIETIDAKHIFIDIVNYTHNRSVEAQTDLIKYLNKFVLNAIKLEKVEDNQLIFIPTGDGMCITLLDISKPFDIHIEIALNILKQISEHNKSMEDEMRKFEIRIGINENTDNLIIDINKNKNISGAGINLAARIEGQGDAGQILVGNAVFEKLNQREKYMNYFSHYRATVKHGLNLDIYQYQNKDLEYLNNEIPNKFKPQNTFEKKIKLTKTQAFYLAHCIKNENFFDEKVDGILNEKLLKILTYQLSNDSIKKSLQTKTSIKIDRFEGGLDEYFKKLKLIDNWIIIDYCSLITEKHLNPILELFSEDYLYINDNGKKQLKIDFPDIYKEFIQEG